jgi:hypothetical protein
MIHPTNCTCDAYACELRRKGIGFGYDATPTMRPRRPWRPKVNCSWEAGISGESRPGGTFMPHLDATGRPIRVKEAGERRRELTDIRRRQIQGTAS